MAAPTPRPAAAPPLSPRANAALGLLSCLAAAPFPREALLGQSARPFLERAALLTADADRPADSATDGFSSALDELRAAGIVTESDGAVALSASGAERARVAPTADRRRAWIEIALGLVNAVTPEDADDPRTWPQWRLLHPHVERILEQAEHEGIADPTGHLMGDKLGVYLYVQGDLARAEMFLQRAFEIDQAHFGDDSPAVAVDITNLSFALSTEGHDDDARLLRERAVEIFGRHEAQEAIHFIVALGNLADIVADSDPAEAERLYRQSLDVAERHVGETHKVTAQALRKLGQHLLAAGSNSGGAPTATARRAEAAALLRRALAQDETACGADHPCVALDLEALAEALAGLEPPESRIPLLERALRIERAWREAGAAKTVEVRRRLIQVMEEAGRPREARALRLDEEEEAIVARLEATPRNPRLLNDYAMFLKNERGDFAGAERAYQKALEVVPDDANLHNNLAVLLASALNRPEEAEEHFIRSLELAPQDASTLGNFALLVQNHRRQMDEAERLYRMALELNPRDANAHSNYASLLIVTGRLDDAEANLAAAWSAQQAAGHDRISARILFQGALLRCVRGGNAAPWLGRLKTLFARGVAQAPWAVSTLVEWLPEHLAAEDAALYRDIIRAIVDSAARAALETSAFWTTLPAVPLDGPWELVVEV